MCTECKKQIAGMKRKSRKKGGNRRHSRRRVHGIGAPKQGDIMDVATGKILPAVGGAVLANYTDNLPGLKENPQAVPWVNLVGGTIAAVYADGFLAWLGAGAAIVGGKQLVDTYAMKGIGLTPAEKVWDAKAFPNTANGTPKQI